MPSMENGQVRLDCVQAEEVCVLAKLREDIMQLPRRLVIKEKMHRYHLYNLVGGQKIFKECPSMRVVGVNAGSMNLFFFFFNK